MMQSDRARRDAAWRSLSAHRLAGLALIVLAGCSRGGYAGNAGSAASGNDAVSTADANSAGFAPLATDATPTNLAPVDTISAPHSPTSSRSPIASPDAIVSPVPTASPDTLSGRALAPDSAEAAADVVRRYYALIETRRYAQAWALWSDGGRASGKSPAAFAAGFAAYRDYHAKIGVPGLIDAGAGQRYVTVPVEASGRLARGGGAFDFRGEVTLHRTGDIDGATAEQRSWRINNVDLKSAPAAPPPTAASPPPAKSARYRCVSGFRFTAMFDTVHGAMTLMADGRGPVVLADQHPASGIWYRGGGYQLRGTGPVATLTSAGQPPLPCIAH